MHFSIDYIPLKRENFRLKLLIFFQKQKINQSNVKIAWDRSK